MMMLVALKTIGKRKGAITYLQEINSLKANSPVLAVHLPFIRPSVANPPEIFPIYRTPYTYAV